MKITIELPQEQADALQALFRWRVKDISRALPLFPIIDISMPTRAIESAMDQHLFSVGLHHLHTLEGPLSRVDAHMLIQQALLRIQPERTILDPILLQRRFITILRVLIAEHFSDIYPNIYQRLDAEIRSLLSAPDEVERQRATHRLRMAIARLPSAFRAILRARYELSLSKKKLKYSSKDESYLLAEAMVALEEVWYSNKDRTSQQKTKVTPTFKSEAPEIKKT